MGKPNQKVNPQRQRARFTKEFKLEAVRLLEFGQKPATLLAVEAPRPYMQHPLRLAAEVQGDLTAVGIHSRLREVPTWAEYIDRTTRGEYDLAILGWQADTTDPNDFLSALLDSGAIGTTNRSRYRSRAMDALLKRARMGSDLETRLAAYREAQALFQKDMPWVPLYHGSVFTAYGRAVRGLSIGPAQLVRALP